MIGNITSLVCLIFICTRIQKSSLHSDTYPIKRLN
nr:MAG TPA: hypothetical protein [Caudoviricetes sp.]